MTYRAPLICFVNLDKRLTSGMSINVQQKTFQIL